MPDCPDCKSNSVQSKGYRMKGVHRYLCNNCGRNFQIDNRTDEEKNMIETDKEIEQIENNIEYERNLINKTINVRQDTKDILISLKKYERETYDEVILRLYKNYKATEPQ